jgi:hypothetical protein
MKGILREVKLIECKNEAGAKFKLVEFKADVKINDRGDVKTLKGSYGEEFAKKYFTYCGVKTKDPNRKLMIKFKYGNLNSKCEDGIDALTIQLSRNTNALLESVFDRDMMISEYIEKEKQTQNIKQDFISSLAHDLKVPIIAQDNTYDLFLNGNFGELSDIQRSAIKNLKISNNDLKNLSIKNYKINFSRPNSHCT